MRKFAKISVLILLFSSFVIPFIPVTAEPKPAQADPLVFRYGLQISPAGGDWDPAIRRASTADSARFPSLEGFVTYPAYWNGDVNTLIPCLATDWAFEYWPIEKNSKGAFNSGGIMATNLTLRENVTFHDGSLWNATVAKWNLDRIMIVSGNLTGRGNTQYLGDFWEDAADYLPFYTKSWNFSSSIGKMPSYNGMTAFIPQLNGTFPKIKNVTIIEAGGPNGGGKIRINYNDWASFSVWEILAGNPQHYILMMSMEAYADYWDRPIFGFGEIPGFPQDETFKHLVGTGPYIFDHWTTTGPTTGGLMTKNENYWNKTALEDVGWFQIDEIQFVLFSADADGTAARNLAMKTGAIDFSPDISGFNFVYDEVIAQADVTYYENPIGDYPLGIILNCVNDTYWVNVTTTNGLPRLTRKAISYAFDYEGFMQTAYNGRADRMNSYLGKDQLYANPSIPIPYLNLTIAREAILAQYPAECAARLLDENSTDEDWTTVATSNPIYTVDFYWDTTSVQQVLADYMGTALHNIGLAYYDDASHELPSVWPHILGGGAMTAQIWASTWAIAPNDIGHAHINAYFKYPGPYTVWYNLAFSYLDNVTDWIDQIYFSNSSTRQVLYDNIGITLQTYQYPWMWVCHGRFGYVYRREWEVREFEFYWGMPTIVGDLTHIKWVGWSAPIPEIPGYSMYITLAISAATTAGIIYIMMKKRK
jgi:ABC-type transport system substrate-binding protein